MNNSKPQIFDAQPQAMRMNAETALRERARKLTTRAARLTALADEIAGKLSHEADEGLWELALHL